MNDKYALYVTFNDILNEFNNKINREHSILEWIVKDLGDNNKTLNDIFIKWSKMFSDNIIFLKDLCEEIIDEEKQIAIPNIFMISKFRNHIA
jgi:hypothetical protein